MRSENEPAVLTPWFSASAKPARDGRYRAQDKNMNCSCCWIDLEFRGGEWFSNLCDPSRYSTHFFIGNLKRWRGLARAAAIQSQGRG